MLFTRTLDQFNAFLLNKSIKLCHKNELLHLINMSYFKRKEQINNEQ